MPFQARFREGFAVSGKVDAFSRVNAYEARFLEAFQRFGDRGLSYIKYAAQIHRADGSGLGGVGADHRLGPAFGLKAKNGFNVVFLELRCMVFAGARERGCRDGHIANYDL